MPPPSAQDIEQVATLVETTARRLHRDLGPGLLESVYEVVLAKLLADNGLRVERQKPVAIRHAGLSFDEGFCADLLVEECLVVELKSQEALRPVHSRQVLTYLRLLDLPLGLLINFGCTHLADGIRRIDNTPPSDPSRPVRPERQDTRRRRLRP